MTGYPNAPDAPELQGEAPQGRYSVRTGDGNETDPSYAIFPIVRYDEESHIYILGTGFYISTQGLFITARHVLMAPFNSDGQQQFPIGVIHFLPKSEPADFIFRPILRCATHAIADVAIGVAAPMNKPDGAPLTNPVLTLDAQIHPVGERITTYCYPRHTNAMVGPIQIINLLPRWYDGTIEHYFPNGRDQTMLPAPCYQTSMVIHDGASGGPVFSPSGSVFGINSTGYDGTQLSFVSRIYEVLQLAIDGIAMGKEPVRRVEVTEIALAGHITFIPPLACY